MDRLGWRRPDVMPHATREIPTMRGLIDQLIARGAAYRLEGSVYFSGARAPHYGGLSRYSRAKMRRILAEQDDARLDDPRRRDPLDFALWRRVPSGPVWPSRFGAGRPGWHLECSAMALRHLGDHIDIHGGGSDLVYPHHENEIAQSETATGTRPFVTFWLHAGPVRLGGRKMSKSDGNMVFVRDALARATPQALRLYLLDRHYRRPFDHFEDRLAKARTRAPPLADRLAGAPVGPLAGDAATREVLTALEGDLHTERAIRALLLCLGGLGARPLLRRAKPDRDLDDEDVLRDERGHGQEVVRAEAARCEEEEAGADRGEGHREKPRAAAPEPRRDDDARRQDDERMRRPDGTHQQFQDDRADHGHDPHHRAERTPHWPEHRAAQE